MGFEKQSKRSMKEKSDTEDLRAVLREAQESLAELHVRLAEDLVEELVSDKSRERGREHIGG
jgi:5-bromo-4-chloroindolyl phosphate hydrolysis protein